MRHSGPVWLLSFAAGGIDALSFVTLGVFTSAVSGNAILLGIALGQGRLSDASRSLIAFAGFAVGVAIASAVSTWPPRRVLLIEAALLAIFAMLWPERVAALHAPMALWPKSLPWLLILAGAAMGVQSATGRRLGVPGINTVVFTTTITEIVGALTGAVLRREPRGMEAKTWRQIGALTLYVAGAAILAMFAIEDVRFAAVPPVVCVLLAAILA
ncbi:MAG: YoaK family protein [Acetobacteraceae bacterium]